MCVAFLAYQQIPHYPLMVTLNRDEFYNRPTLPLQTWESNGQKIVSGIDQAGGGTWMGMSPQGRIALITNYRDMTNHKTGVASRGDLVRRFLEGAVPVADYIREVRETKDDYNGYNLIFGEIELMYYYSNVQDTLIELKPGIYGISNHVLDTPWPKVVRGKARFTELLQSGAPQVEDILELMGDITPAEDGDLPATGLKYELEKTVSSIFIASAKYSYGTRSTSVISVDDNGNVSFVEQTHIDHERKAAELRKMEFKIGR